jgi:DNA-binding NtrC family response regulator
LLCESKEIQPEHLSIAPKKAPESLPGKDLKEGASYERIIENVEADLIRKTLEKTGGNKTKAAKLLNMNRKTFYRRLKKLGLLP